MLSTRQFSYNKDTRTFVAEASDLGSDPFQRIYEDAADEGVELVSHVTGKSAKFAVNSYERNDDHEFIAWNLVPTAETIRKNPRMRGVTMIIFND